MRFLCVCGGGPQEERKRKKEKASLRYGFLRLITLITVSSLIMEDTEKLGWQLITLVLAERISYVEIITAN